jgi:hypothetical protein
LSLASSGDSDAFSWGPDSEWDREREDASLDADDEGDHESGLNWTIGALAVLYVAWALMWVMGLARTPALVTGSAFDDLLYQVGVFLAYISAPLWFVGVVWLGTHWSPRRRTGILLLGLILLLPWPFILPAVLT